VFAGIVHAVYVRPNEISIERPYIDVNIQATFDCFRPEPELHGTSVCASFVQAAVDPVQDATLLDQCSPWDLSCLHATIGQIQAPASLLTRFPQPT